MFAFNHRCGSDVEFCVLCFSFGKLTRLTGTRGHGGQEGRGVDESTAASAGGRFPATKGAWPRVFTCAGQSGRGGGS